MASGMELQGLDELLNKLKAIGDNVDKYEDKALKDAADIVEQSQKDIVQREALDTGKLRDGLKKGRVTTKQGVKSISIGIQKSDNSKIFYGKFINWGFTRRKQQKRSRNRREVIEVVPGINFMERSIAENKSKVIEAMKSAIKEGIDSAKR